MREAFVAAFFDELEKLAGARVDPRLPRYTERATRLPKFFRPKETYHPGSTTSKGKARRKEELPLVSKVKKKHPLGEAEVSTFRR